MSSTSSESWNATPNTSPKRVSVSTTGAGAPDSSAPKRAEACPPHVHQGASGLGDERVSAARRGPQQLPDRAEPRANALFERRVGHREPERLGRHLHAHDCRLPFIATAHVESTLMHD